VGERILGSMPAPVALHDVVGRRGASFSRLGSSGASKSREADTPPLEGALASAGTR
jgi:hypothetical protein